MRTHHVGRVPGSEIKTITGVTSEENLMEHKYTAHCVPKERNKIQCVKSVFIKMHLFCPA